MFVFMLDAVVSCPWIYLARVLHQPIKSFFVSSSSLRGFIGCALSGWSRMFLRREKMEQAYRKNISSARVLVETWIPEDRKTSLEHEKRKRICDLSQNLRRCVFRRTKKDM
ncbi:MAG: uncharacterized protein A8A55_1352 [Amphiamblys sp. WSBS2006]|nr:MAG: uncharacterized protein A8A55_1352 [Amphiamblys sp. WSBS2006]